jgi:hypothetical protein
MDSSLDTNAFRMGAVDAWLDGHDFDWMAVEKASQLIKGLKRSAGASVPASFCMGLTMPLCTL